MRWLSPPDKVPEARAKVRYSSPTSLRKESRSRISLRMRAAISFCFGVSFAGSSAAQAAAWRIESAVTAAISAMSILTASASGFSRLPPQVAQGVSDMKRAISSRAQSLSVSL
jgi:hypothetical protein